MTLTDDSAKTSLFGQVNKSQASGDHRPDSEAIREVLADGSAIAVFCRGCGRTQGLSKSGLDSLLDEAGLQPIGNPSEFLLSCGRCPICFDSFDGMELIRR